MCESRAKFPSIYLLPPLAVGRPEKQAKVIF